MNDDDSRIGGAMTENQLAAEEAMLAERVVAASDLEDLSQSVADQAESYLIALRGIAGTGDVGRAVPLLLLEVSQLLLAGARLGAQVDFVPTDTYEPDAGPDPDVDKIREALATMLADFDVYTEVFDPYFDPPELIRGRISDDVTAIASSVAHGLQHHRAGRYEEALWWWQFSYVSSWGSEASAALRALQWIISHDRLDTEPDAAAEASAEKVQIAGV